MAAELQALARLDFRPGLIEACQGGERIPITPNEALILEVFVHHRDYGAAYDTYCRAMRPYPPTGALLGGARRLPDIGSPITEGFSAILLKDMMFLCSPPRSSKAFMIANVIHKSKYVSGLPPEKILRDSLENEGISDVTSLSRQLPCIAVALAHCLGSLRSSTQPTFHAFRYAVSKLWDKGLLTVPVGEVQWGDLRHMSPMCPEYGFTRGTPVDRHYLNRFIADIRDKVRGLTLEVGGRRGNRAIYDFPYVTNYITIDSDTVSDPDIVADVHDQSAVRSSTVDSVLIFNVLEHCAQPWLVVANIHNWLRNGGKAFCLVPNAQRIHRAPDDFWRILPDGLASLFAIFDNSTITTYGNILTSSASLAGIAAEELTTDELNHYDPRYPVVSCISAMKKSEGTSS